MKTFIFLAHWFYQIEDEAIAVAQMKPIFEVHSSLSNNNGNLLVPVHMHPSSEI